MNLHLFGILLACKIYGEPLSSQGVRIGEVRSSLDYSLRTLRAIERTSLMSRKAGDCLRGFLKVFDSLCKLIQTTTSTYTGLDTYPLSYLNLADVLPHFRTASEPVPTIATYSNAPVEDLGAAASLRASGLFPEDNLPENFFSQFVGQSADDFLFHCSDNTLLDADLDFFQNLY